MAEEQSPAKPGSGADGNGGPVVPGAVAPGERVKKESGGNGGPGTGLASRDSSRPGSVIGNRPAGPAKAPAVASSRASGLWVGLTFSAVVLLFLLIFIVQNNVPTVIRFLGLSATLPVGVALLFAAALGVLLVAIPGYLRILQLRRAARKRAVS